MTFSIKNKLTRKITIYFSYMQIKKPFSRGKTYFLSYKIVKKLLKKTKFYDIENKKSPSGVFFLDM